MIKGKLNFEDFQKFNYILYDQYLFRNLLDIYENEKVKYKILAINVFKEKQIAPIVIRIDSMSPALLQDYYENIYLGSRLADLHLILPNEVPQLSC
ncbi:hypothetical protein [Acinetobacter colistiniresistens]|uniref:Uncharacterized protein n=1 Tax=Acinetobacter colistiniresistens TaxID=280145 RepID=S3T9A1_9GAMM|nr:hypothetical protein [Acinetobacter colistiniresistens]EPG37508.1 hypothetical protein F907_01477 [Acinetobacter colistiniresistens]